MIPPPRIPAGPSAETNHARWVTDCIVAIQRGNIPGFLTLRRNRPRRPMGNSYQAQLSQYFHDTILSYQPAASNLKNVLEYKTTRGIMQRATPRTRKGSPVLDFLDTESFIVYRTIEDGITSGTGRVLPLVVRGTFHGLIYGERTFTGRPESIDPTLEQPIPYNDCFAISHRFRKRYIHVRVEVPWIGNGADENEPWRYADSQLIFPTSEKVRVFAESEGGGVWEIPANPSGTYYALGTPESNYDNNPEATTDRVSGVNSRGNIAGGAPVQTASGALISQSTEPTIYSFNTDGSGTNGTGLGQSILESTAQAFEVRIDMHALISSELYSQFGTFVRVNCIPLSTLLPQHEGFAGQNVVYTVTAHD